MALALVPMTVKAARKWVRETHSHLDAPPGGLFAVGVAEDGRLCCVALAGNPNARMLQWKALNVSRGASDGTAEHAAGMSTMALVRAGRALGYSRFTTYTILGEPGTVYRATGWRPVALGKGGEWDRKSRRRPKAAQPGEKVRWETGPGAYQPETDEERDYLAWLDGFVRDCVGKVAIPPRPRRDEMPLFERTGEAS